MSGSTPQRSIPNHVPRRPKAQITASTTSSAPVRSAQVGDAFDVPGGGWVHTAGADHRFHEHRRHSLRADPRECLLHLLQRVVSHLDRLVQRSEAHLVAGDTAKRGSEPVGAVIRGGAADQHACGPARRPPTNSGGPAWPRCRSRRSRRSRRRPSPASAPAPRAPPRARAPAGWRGQKTLSMPRGAPSGRRRRHESRVCRDPRSRTTGRRSRPGTGSRPCPTPTRPPRAPSRARNGGPSPCPRTDARTMSQYSTPHLPGPLEEGPAVCGISRELIAGYAWSIIYSNRGSGLVAE